VIKTRNNNNMGIQLEGLIKTRCLMITMCLLMIVVISVGIIPKGQQFYLNLVLVSTIYFFINQGIFLSCLCVKRIKSS